MTILSRWTREKRSGPMRNREKRETHLVQMTCCSALISSNINISSFDMLQYCTSSQTWLCPGMIRRIGIAPCCCAKIVQFFSNYNIASSCITPRARESTVWRVASIRVFLFTTTHHLKLFWLGQIVDTDLHDHSHRHGYLHDEHPASWSNMLVRRKQHRTRNLRSAVVAPQHLAVLSLRPWLASARDSPPIQLRDAFTQRSIPHGYWFGNSGTNPLTIREQLRKSTAWPIFGPWSSC